MAKCNVPVLFLVFNRLDTTIQVFEEIRKAKPKKLFVSCDGPRNDGEKKKVEAVREYVLGNVDWDCEVKTLFRNKNLGCGRAVSSAIDWFFNNVEMGIILEDDCLPDQSFFPFCEELLEKYKNNKKIMHISGDNFLYGSEISFNTSYCFSKYAHIWGWATWRRAWKEYDFKMVTWPVFKKNLDFLKLFDSKNEEKRFISWFDQMYNFSDVTWDLQLLYTLWKNNGLAVYPEINMIKNIGFSKKSTNTIVSRKFIVKTKLQSIQFPLNHPRVIKRAIDVDKITFNIFFKRNLVLKVFDLSPNIIKVVLRKVYSLYLGFFE